MGGTLSFLLRWTKALEDVQQFWRALMSDACFSGRLIMLGDGACFMGDPPSGNKMIVRECYRDVYDCIMSKHHKGLLRFVVTGAPGIGKSFFKFPLMRWLIKEGKAKHIVLQVDGNRYLFSHDSDVLMGDERAFDEKLHQETTWWIIDQSSAAPAHPRKAPTIVLSSPNKARYKEFWKLPGATQLYMKLWTGEEIEECRAACFPDLSMDLVNELQAKWGNIPRYVLDKAQDEQAQASLDVAIRLCKLETVWDCIGLADSAPEASHKLVHPNVSRPDAQPIMQLASQYVSGKVIEQTAKQQLESVLHSVRDLMSQPAYMAAAGALFEAYAHRQLEAGGTFKVRKLGTAKHENLDLLAAPSFKVFKKVEEVAIVDDGVYCRPQVHNFPAVDAIVQPCSMYQMTVAQKQDINAAGLQSVRSQLRGPTYRLYFCVPGMLYSRFSKVDLEADDVEQWVLEIPGFEVEGNGTEDRKEKKAAPPKKLQMALARQVGTHDTNAAAAAAPKTRGQHARQTGKKKKQGEAETVAPAKKARHKK